MVWPRPEPRIFCLVSTIPTFIGMPVTVVDDRAKLFMTSSIILAVTCWPDWLPWTSHDSVLDSCHATHTYTQSQTHDGTCDKSVNHGSHSNVRIKIRTFSGPTANFRGPLKAWHNFSFFGTFQDPWKRWLIVTESVSDGHYAADRSTNQWHVAAPRAWNMLPTELKLLQSTTHYLLSPNVNIFVPVRIWTSGCRLMIGLWCTLGLPVGGTIQRPQLQLQLHTHPFKGPFPGLPRWANTRKVKPIWILLKQETVSGSGISWAICKSAPRSRQITTPAPHHSVFYRPDALPATQPTVSKHWRPLQLQTVKLLISLYCKYNNKLLQYW